MTTCVPMAQGVPGLSTAPNWFDSAAGAPPLRQDVDDPRWTGAYNRGHGDGTGLEAEFRGIYMNPDWRAKKSLFLQWRVLYDGNLNNGLDRLYVGFNNGGAAAADTLLLKIVAYNSSGANINCQAAGSLQAFTMDPVTGLGTALSNVPNWVNQVRVWLTRTPIGWTINLYLPYDPAAAGLYSDNGIKLPDPFQMFYQIYVLTSTRKTGTTVVGGFVPHKWPLTSSSVFSGLSGDVYPHPPSAAAQWDAFHLSTGPGDPICPIAGGVSITYSGIGNMVDGGAPNIIIKYRKTLSPPRPVNTLFANINNQTGDSIPVGGITARFRIADWGSVIMDPTAPWQDIRGGGAVSNEVAIPAGLFAVAPGNPPPLHFDWTLNDQEMDPYINSGKPSDQCILVELTGAGITFFSDSARQNHLIQAASEVRKSAQISIEGLEPIGGTHRDVYVAVETVNMPPPSTDEHDGNGGNTGEGGDVIGIRGTENQPSGAKTRVVWDDEKLALLRQRDIGSKTLNELVQRGWIETVATGGVRLERILDLVPTYRVHVYHDTGEHLTVDGVDYPILAAQTSFGMLLDHVGPFTGWEHALAFPPGALQEEIAQNFYRVHVPNNGKITTGVRVRAVEPGEVGSGGLGRISWWVWLLLLLILLLFALRG